MFVMPNTVIVEYAIEGPKKQLRKIAAAIKNHPVEEDFQKDCEGSVLKALGINTAKENYPQGVILQEPAWIKDALCFTAQESVNKVSFKKLLKEKFSEIRVFYFLENNIEGIYTTNDRFGKYFPERYSVDTCIDGYYYCEYFSEKKDIYKWLFSLTKGKIKSDEDIEHYSASCDGKDFIVINKFTVEKDFL